MAKPKLQWIEQSVTAGRAPWMADLDRLRLFVQPWYGDGIKYRGIIHHPLWVLTLRTRFTDLEMAQYSVEVMAARLLEIEDSGSKKPLS